MAYPAGPDKRGILDGWVGKTRSHPAAGILFDRTHRLSWHKRLGQRPTTKGKTVKLNVGCGTDYREGFVNIDGSKTLSKIDKVIDISTESLLSHFKEGTVDYILANDIIEHQFHWEAVRIMKDFHTLLRPGGKVEIRVPDAQYIIRSWRFSLDKKLNLLFGGQDIPQGRDAEMDESRKKFPQYFCHKFGWTMKSMDKELRDIGFSVVRCERAYTNFIAYGTK
jgi:predicted SAM-dependent methyltransferase